MKLAQVTVVGNTLLLSGMHVTFMEKIIAIIGSFCIKMHIQTQRCTYGSFWVFVFSLSVIFHVHVAAVFLNNPPWQLLSHSRR